MMNTFEKIREIICDILDFEPDDINEESYMVRELDTESIDFLELSLEISERFKIDVKDDDLFLRNLRFYKKEAEDSGCDVAAHIAQKLPHLDHLRISHAMADLEGGPVLKVKDLMAYADYHA